ncbi:MAG: hypothetical protein Q9165_002383 [Trypethelium subeluteriae]
MEVNNQRRASGLRDKIPDIEKTLETVQFLKRRKPDSEPLETTFELNDTLYAKAEVPRTEEVYLWLGVCYALIKFRSTTGHMLTKIYSTKANVMLSYPIPEAQSLLESRLETAQTSLANCEEDLDFLREQITTMEVATARVYNWDVVQRRKENAEGKDSKEIDPEKAPNG